MKQNRNQMNRIAASQLHHRRNRTGVVRATANFIAVQLAAVTRDAASRAILDAAAAPVAEKEKEKS